LHNIHSKKLIHFDIKTDNILLSHRGEALISDFGLAQKTNVAGTAEQDRMYFKMLPPEAHQTSAFTSAFDIYQFGLTLYRMCNGNAEFLRQFDKFGPATSFNRDQFRYDLRNGLFPDRDVFLEHIPNRLRRLVKKCLEPDPSQRFPSAIEVANELAQVEDRLDWQYTAYAGERVWRREDEAREFQLRVASNGTSIAQRTMKSPGRSSRSKTSAWRASSLRTFSDS
jgi:serine/threonine protein kinase